MNENVLSGFLKALSSGAIRVVDLSQPLDAGTATIQLPPEFGKTWPFRLEEISKYDSRGPAWYWNNFSCGEHTGTHFDAPIHWVTGKDYPNNATDNIPVEEILRPGLRHRRFARSCQGSRFPAHASARRNLGDHIRPNRSRLLGPDAHRLVEAQRRRIIPQHQRRRFARPRPASRSGPISRKRSRRHRLGLGRRRHRRRPGLQIQPAISLPHHHARQQ